MLYVLRREVGNLTDLLVCIAFTVPESQNFPVFFVDDIRVDHLTHVESVIARHKNTSKDNAATTPVLWDEWRLIVLAALQLSREDYSS